MDAATVGAISAQISALSNKGTRLTTAGTANYTPVVTGWHEIILQGAGGGSGGVKFTFGSGNMRSGGGEAGEWLKVRMWLVAGTAYSRTIGAGGTAGTSAGGNGGTGGSTTFTGPDFTATALGGGGSPGLALGASQDGNGGGTSGRKDAISTSSQPTALTGPDNWGGANGGAANGSPGGYSGTFVGSTSSARAGSGGCSMFAQGGAGASSGNTVGTAGTFGAGAGGSWSIDTTGVAGAVGGAGLIEIIYIGTL